MVVTVREMPPLDALKIVDGHGPLQPVAGV
jgi:hypothetical protein